MTTSRNMLESAMSEAEAIEGAKQGDGECFESLYKLHKRRVYSLCLRMTGNTEAAEDFTQDAFLQLYRAWAARPTGDLAMRNTIGILEGDTASATRRDASGHLWGTLDNSCIAEIILAAVTHNAQGVKSL